MTHTTAEWLEFLERFLDLTLEKVEDWFKEEFGGTYCHSCSEELQELEVEREEYEVKGEKYVIHNFSCPRCRTPLLKLYSESGRFLGVVGEPSKVEGADALFSAVANCIKGNLERPLQGIGSPIPTSKDYGEKTTGRPRKYDYREIDKQIWEFLQESWRTKYGFDTSVIFQYIVKFNRKNYSRRLIFNRLTDMEQRGLIAKARRKYGKSWKWFWVKISWHKSPHCYYPQVFPELDRFQDREDFPFQLSSPYPWSGLMMTMYNPEEMLDGEERWIRGESLNTERGRKRRLRKARERLKQGWYGKATPWIEEIANKYIQQTKENIVDTEEKGTKSKKRGESVLKVLPGLGKSRSG